MVRKFENSKNYTPHPFPNHPMKIVIWIKALIQSENYFQSRQHTWNCVYRKQPELINQINSSMQSTVKQFGLV
jgi:hypothetical protein